MRLTYAIKRRYDAGFPSGAKRRTGKPSNNVIERPSKIFPSIFPIWLKNQSWKNLQSGKRNPKDLQEPERLIAVKCPKQSENAMWSLEVFILGAFFHNALALNQNRKISHLRVSIGFQHYLP